MWTTLVEVKWRWALLAFALSFTLSWLGFSVVYMCIMYAHGDFEYKPHWKPCLVSVDTFAAIFMFSLETQTTIGYGFRYVEVFFIRSKSLLLVELLFPTRAVDFTWYSSYSFFCNCNEWFCIIDIQATNVQKSSIQYASNQCAAL